MEVKWKHFILIKTGKKKWEKEKNKQTIMYGKLVKEFDKSLGREVYTLDCTKWQIYSEVKRGNYSFRIPYKHFITIYDLKYFDFLLTD